MAKITDKYFEYNNKKYFRTNAHQIELASHGKAAKSGLQPNYLAPKGKIARKHLEKRAVKMLKPVSINWNSVSKSDFGDSANLKIFGIGADVSESASLNQARSGDINLVGIYINRGPLERCLNHDADTVRNAMSEEGRDARIAFFVWLAFDSALASHFYSNFERSVSVSALGQKLGITVKGGKYGEQTVKIGNGETFAYANYKVKDWSKGKKQIDKLEDDYFGIG